MAVSAANPLAKRPYYAALSANFSARSSVMDLLVAAYAALTPTQNIPALTGAQITLCNIAANGKKIFVGDASLTTSNYAREIPITTTSLKGEITYGPFREAAIPLQDIYVMAEDGSTSVKVGIEVVIAG